MVLYCDHGLRFPGRYSTVTARNYGSWSQYCTARYRSPWYCTVTTELRFPRYSTVTTNYGSRGTVQWPRNYGSQGGTVLWPRTTVPRAVQYSGTTDYGSQGGTVLYRTGNYGSQFVVTVLWPLGLRFRGHCTVPPWDYRSPWYCTVTWDYGSQGGTVLWPRTTVPRAVQYCDHGLRFPGRYSTVTTDYGSQGGTVLWPRTTVPWSQYCDRPGNRTVPVVGTVLWPRTTVPRAVQYSDHGLRFPGRYSTVTTGNYGSQGGTVQWPRTSWSHGTVQWPWDYGSPRAVQYCDHGLRFPGRYSTVTTNRTVPRVVTVLWPPWDYRSPRVVTVLWPPWDYRSPGWSLYCDRPGNRSPGWSQYCDRPGTTVVPGWSQYCTALGNVVRGHCTVPPWEP